MLFIMYSLTTAGWLVAVVGTDQQDGFARMAIPGWPLEKATTKAVTYEWIRPHKYRRRPKAEEEDDNMMGTSTMMVNGIGFGKMPAIIMT